MAGKNKDEKSPKSLAIPFFAVFLAGNLSLCTIAVQLEWGDDARMAIFLGGGIVMVAYMFTQVNPLRQDLEYHKFADRRPLCCAVPNSFDVLSNIPFAVIGGMGLLALHPDNTQIVLISEWERTAWSVFFAGIFLVAFGSAYYHLNPNNNTLVWDRLPMTIGFMSLFAIVLAERVSTSVGETVFVPLIILGFFSVFLWHFTDDLRLYALVQFYPLICLPETLMIFDPKYTLGSHYIWGGLWYVVAKVVEAKDRQIFVATGKKVSGHTLKHLAAAVTPYVLLEMLMARDPLQ